MKKTKLALFFLITIAVLLFFYTKNDSRIGFLPILESFLVFFKKDRNASIAQKLKNIPEDEYQCLDFFFRSNFNTLGYCLFGTKPMAVLGYYDPLVGANNVDEMIDHIFCAFNSRNLRVYRGWELWKKYRHFFPMKNYGFIKSKNFIDNDYVSLILINKKEFLKTVSIHLNDFKDILGNGVTPELLLEEVLKSQDVFGDVLKHHQGLIGTVLGFGRHNAWLFHRREEISSLNGEVSPLLGKTPHFFKKFSEPTSREELNTINQALQVFADRGIRDFNPLFMSLPGFVADPNANETQQLKAEYESQQHQIIHRYQKGEFLEITLKQMTSENDP